ncbi:MAG TPA: ferredoxin family protein [Candidatus Methylomirabilis sp.]|nr:ferredoxin family protein [Candidatus Methylomirabilis sp.]
MKAKWAPVVDADKCTGCGSCVEACGVQCLDVTGGTAVLLRPAVCRSEELCIWSCRHDAIHMAWMGMAGDEAVGVWH